MSVQVLLVCRKHYIGLVVKGKVGDYLPASGCCQNPISVNPLDIQSSQLYNTSTGYNNSSKWVYAAPNSFGSSLTQHIATPTTINGNPVIMFQTNGTSTGATEWRPYFSIPFASYPSNNIAYDYLTVIANISTSFTASGQSVEIGIENTTGIDTGTNIWINTTNNLVSTAHSLPIYPSNTIEFSAPLSDLKGLNWNNTESNGLTVELWINIPATQTSTYETITVDSIQMTENPLYLGTAQINGTQQALEDFTGNAHLTSFNPDFSWS